MPKSGERELPAYEVSGQWRGLFSSIGPQSIPPGGAQVQINFVAHTPGELTTRAGIREVKFEN